MLKVKVYAKTETRKGADREFITQVCELDCGPDEPGRRFNLSVDAPLVPGDYTLGADAFVIGKYERLELASFGLARALTPVASSVKRVA